MIEAIQICDFEPRYQDAAAGLINEGLGDRFGIADPSMNPDLYDIAESYESGEFLLALDDTRLVGTGALMPQDPNTGQIARMHTARGSSQRARRGYHKHSTWISLIAENALLAVVYGEEIVTTIALPSTFTLAS